MLIANIDERYPLDKVLGFTWAFRTGTTPGGGSFAVPIEQADDFRALAGPGHKLRVRWVEGSATRAAQIEDLWISSNYTVETRGDAVIARFPIFDFRRLWQHRRVVGYWGMTRRTNDLEIRQRGEELDVVGQNVDLRGGVADILPDIRDGKIIGFRPADIVGRQTTFPRTVYRDLTLDWSNDDFSGPSTEPRPWTPLRAVMGLLLGSWFKRPDGSFGRRAPILTDGQWGGFHGFDGRDPDNGLPLARQAHINTPLPQVLDEWMRLARVNCTVWKDGKLYLHPMDLSVEPDLPDDELYRGGRLVTVDPATDRPAVVKAGYRRELEQAFSARIETDTPAEQNKSVSVPPRGNVQNVEDTAPVLYNVIRLPELETIDLGDGNGPQEFPAGSYLPIEPVLKAWSVSSEWLASMWFQSIDVYYPLLYGVSEEGDSGDGEVPPGSQRTIQRVQAMKDAYRSLYMLPSSWVKHILELRSDSIVLLDRVTDTRQPTPVWMDYGIARNHKYGPYEVEDAEDLWHNELWEVDPNSPEDAPLPADDAAPSPFRVEVVDEEIGLVRIAPLNDNSGIIDSLYPGGVVPLDPDVGPVKVEPNFNGITLAQSRLAPEYKFCAYLTVTSLDPNSEDNLHWVEIPATDFGVPEGYVPVHEVVVMDETARFDVDGALVNEEALLVRSRAVAQSIYESLNPRLEGQLTYSGLEAIYPIGTAAATEWTLSNRVVTTRVHYPPPNLQFAAEEFMSPSYRDYVLRLPGQ